MLRALGLGPSPRLDEGGHPRQRVGGHGRPQRHQTLAGDDPTDRAADRQGAAGVVEGTSFHTDFRLTNDAANTTSGPKPTMNVSRDRRPTPSLISTANARSGAIPHNSHVTRLGWFRPRTVSTTYSAWPDGADGSAQEHEVDVEHGPSLCPSHCADAYDRPDVESAGQGPRRPQRLGRVAPGRRGASTSDAGSSSGRRRWDSASSACSGSSSVTSRSTATTSSPARGTGPAHTRNRAPATRPPGPRTRHLGRRR